MGRCRPGDLVQAIKQPGMRATWSRRQKRRQQKAIGDGKSNKRHTSYCTITKKKKNQAGFNFQIKILGIYFLIRPGAYYE